ncbi:Cys-tRNA(Pro)/Cys-tRNA(Cys) deacylase YbaK [uncultured bacterium]|nr:Cys-tRNA(Pro)/Cys-tRNA(Cys) deacylase YbaK [uncultured bacterium]
MQTLTPQTVIADLQRRGLDRPMRFFETTTATSQQAADNIGCELGQIVKSLCFIVETDSGRQPILVLASGDQRVDDRKIAGWYNVGRKRVKIATPEECIEIYGYAPGSVPPLAHRTQDLPTYIDASLERYDQLYAAGGAHNAIFPISLVELIRVTGGKMMDVVRKDAENP